jgi:hypothetical protein
MASVCGPVCGVHGPSSYWFINAEALALALLPLLGGLVWRPIDIDYGPVVVVDDGIARWRSRGLAREQTHVGAEQPKRWGRIAQLATQRHQRL